MTTPKVHLQLNRFQSRLETNENRRNPRRFWDSPFKHSSKIEEATLGGTHGDYVSKLNDIRQRKNISVNYTFGRAGPPHDPLWTCKVYRAFSLSLIIDIESTHPRIQLEKSYTEKDSVKTSKLPRLRLLPKRIKLSGREM